MNNATFIACIYPDGTRPGFGRLPCPHCGDLHQNPEAPRMSGPRLTQPADADPSLWTLAQIRALVAMRASRVCAGCGKPSTVKLVGEG